MAETLEELAMQGDPGTLASEAQAAKIQLLDPQQLYELWEKQHWLSHEIDFTQGQGGLGQLQRRGARLLHLGPLGFLHR